MRTPPRILVIKFGAIGDVIMTIPAAHALHVAGYQIDWVCGRAVSALLGLYPWIQVIEVDDSAIFSGSLPVRLRVIASLWRRIAGTHYDLCANLYYDWRYKILSLPVRARRTISLSSTQRDFRIIPGRHHSAEFMRILLAGLPSPVVDSESTSQPSLSPLTTLLPASPLLRDACRQRIVLVPAGARNTLRAAGLRRWPVENYVETAKILLARGFEVVLLGGPDDTWASSYFSDLPVSDCIAKYNLVESIALLDSADLVITHDTGPLHMAGSTRAPIVAIFGPTDPHIFLPPRENVVALWGGEGFACRPCYDGRDFAACGNNGCVQQITVAMVLEEVEALLASMREGHALLPRVRVPPHTPLLSTIAPALP